MTSSPLVLRGLRGATTCTENSTEAIEAAVSALMDALVDRNDLSPDQLVSVTFSVTADLDACFPAAIARRRPGWDTVALLDCQQMAVQGDLPAASVFWPTPGSHRTSNPCILIRATRSGSVQTDLVTTDRSDSDP